MLVATHRTPREELRPHDFGKNGGKSACDLMVGRGGTFISSSVPGCIGDLVSPSALGNAKSKLFIRPWLLEVPFVGGLAFGEPRESVRSCGENAISKGGHHE